MRQPTEMLIIRHGQTDWNLEKRLQGHSDIPLNAKGREQAAALAEALRHEKLDAVFSSDLSRAKETAEQIARLHNLPVQVDSAFRERSYGIVEGLSREEIKTRYPEDRAAWYAADPDHVFPPGKYPSESMRAFHNRVTAALYRTAASCAGKRIVLVAHFGILEAAYRVVYNTPIDVRNRVPVQNTSISRFLVGDNTIEMLQWDDKQHLEP